MARLGEVTDRTDLVDVSRLRSNQPLQIVLHSTRSYPTFRELHQYHLSRGFETVGYHFFVEASGKVSQARPVNYEGAHAIGFNTSSIGVCFYSRDGTLPGNKVREGREFLADLNSHLGEVPVISHTLAQVKYYNFLFEKEGIDIRLEENENVVIPANFSAMRQKISSAMQKLDLTKLKPSLKKFKNCPGPMFYYFV